MDIGELMTCASSEELRARWTALSLDERLRLADGLPECGHALAELTYALEHLDREACAAIEHRRAA